MPFKLGLCRCKLDGNKGLILRPVLNYVDARIISSFLHVFSYLSDWRGNLIQVIIISDPVILLASTLLIIFGFELILFFCNNVFLDVFLSPD